MKKILFFLIGSILFAGEFDKLNLKTNIKRKKELKKYIKIYSKKFNIKKEYVYSILEVESHGRNILGDDGESVGYFQIQKTTWEYLYKKYKNKFEVPYIKNKRDFLLTPKAQVYYCFLNLYHIKKNIKKGDEKGIFYSYNAGLTGYKRKKYNKNYYKKIKKVLIKIN